jgi:NAD-dependent deacetylase
VLKPDIVFFGEAVPAIEKACNLVAQCDLLLVLGSSLQVMPASLLPDCTNATTIVINKGEVTLSPEPYRFFIDDDLDEYCRKVAHCLGMDC